MAYRDLLVHVDDTKACAGRVDAAVNLAASREAHLTGVYIVSEPSPASFAQRLSAGRPDDRPAAGDARAGRSRAGAFRRGRRA